MSMHDAEYVPTNFRLSGRAIAKLNELTEILSQSEGRSMVPALFWSEGYDEIKRIDLVLGLALGWYYRDEVPARLLQEVDGVTLIFGVSSEQALRFLSKAVDCEEERFFLAP